MAVGRNEKARPAMMGIAGCAFCEFQQENHRGGEREHGKKAIPAGYSDSGKPVGVIRAKG